MKLLIFALFTLISLGAYADFDAAKAAYQRKDFQTAFKELKILANQDDTGAQFILGYMYRNGEGTPQNYTQALKWSQKSAEKGLAPAQYDVGLMYAHGLGVAQDNHQATFWFILAAEQEDSDALYKLGLLYAINKDYKPAYILCSLAAAYDPKLTICRDAALKKLKPTDVNQLQRTASALFEAEDFTAAFRQWMKTQL